VDHGGGLSHSQGKLSILQEEFIDPRSLSLIKSPVANSSAWTTPYGTDVQIGVSNADYEAFFSPLISGLSFNSQDQNLSKFGLPSLSSTLSEPSPDFQGQSWWENEFSIPQPLNGFTFDTTPHFDQSPSINSCYTPSTQGESPIRPASPSLASEHSQTSSPSSDQDKISLSPSAVSISSTTRIACTWPECNKSFPTRSSYKFVNPHVPLPILIPPISKHFLNHSRPFQCHICPLRHATKRHLSRHINVHLTTERYYCSVNCCKRPAGREGKGFRDDNYKRHLILVHGFSDEEAKASLAGQESRRGRERWSRKGGAITEDVFIV
jgi:hypothetical protein